MRAVAVDRPLTLGRDDTASLVLDDSGVSRLHARVEPRESALWISDLGSHNGTFVNGERLGSEGVPAQAGAVLRLGRTLFVIGNVSPFGQERPAPLSGLIGGAALDDARARIATIAPTKSPVLVLGETGTGKEVVARLLHARSGRAGPFVALNCAAVPGELVDAELFGHARGAFSGAVTARLGQFRAAHGGSLFLDEIGEMPALAQAKLLRVLESEEVRPVGDDQPVQVDVRVVAATNRDLDDLLSAGAFRADLLHRLAGLRIRLPPLRDRTEDIAALAESFLEGTGSVLSAAALEALLLYGWPGNVRELKHVVTSAARMAALSGEPEIGPSSIASLLDAPDAPGGVEELEARRITDALRVSAGDVAVAAKALGRSRSVLYETLRRLSIDPRNYRKR